MDRLFQLYKTVLLAHIRTKTTDQLFHQKSEWFYELLFEVFHTISEKNQDIGVDKAGDCDILAQQAYDAIEEAKTIVESMVKDKNSVWMDNLLRWLADKLEFACGDARAFIEEEKEDYSEIKDKLPNKMPKIPR